MKSCFVAENAAIVKNVYPESVIDQLSDRFGLIHREAFAKKYVLEHPEEFSEVEFLFSTWSMPSFTEEEIRTCFPSLRAVLYAAGSVQGFARPFLHCGVLVFSAWGANAIPVAEMTVAHIILANKGYHMSAFYCSKSASDRKHSGEFMAHNRGNYGCKVGILGIGMVGVEVCRLLQNYHLEVLAFDPFCSQEKANSLGVRLTTLEEIFSDCEVISNHLANNPQTQGMLHYDLFRRMHSHATFINTGRGAQVVEADLVRALQEEPGRCAVLDVTDPEPPEEDSPFYAMDNVILTPHLAGSQKDEWHRMAEYMRDEALAVAEGRPLRYSISLEMLKTMA